MGKEKKEKFLLKYIINLSFGSLLDYNRSIEIYK